VTYTDFGFANAHWPENSVSDRASEQPTSDICSTRMFESGGGVSPVIRYIACSVNASNCPDRAATPPRMFWSRSIQAFAVSQPVDVAFNRGPNQSRFWLMIELAPTSRSRWTQQNLN